MIKKIAIVFGAIIILASSATHAQKLGLGGMINHTSTGILVSYSPAWQGKWNLDVGIRYFAKVNLIGTNEQSFAYYQQGYTESFWEKFAINARLSRKLIAYKFIRLDFMANLLMTCESRMETGPIYGIDPITGNFELMRDNVYFNPSPALELTIGPALNIDCSPKLSIYGAVGWGVIYMNHSHYGWSRTYNVQIHSVDLGTPTQNWKRGAFEGVGSDKLPMISIGAKYKLN